jgi:hypothetical protein
LQQKKRNQRINFAEIIFKIKNFEPHFFISFTFKLFLLQETKNYFDEYDGQER